MRPHGRARISRNFPQALAICDRCGFQFNHNDLHWSFDWQGPRLANQRILVCNTCDDVFFEHNRTILIPADPVPIANPRPEFFVADDNPISPVSFSRLAPTTTSSVLNVSANLGNMRLGGGINAAYAGAPQKPSFLSALLQPSAPTANWLAKNWSAVPGLMPATLPTVMAGQAVALRYAVSGFTAQAPNDQSFLGRVATTITFSGWDGTAWHALWNGASLGIPGETITITALANVNLYYVHALSILGDGTNPAAVAFLQINANAEGVLSPVVEAPSFAPVPPRQMPIGAVNYGYAGAVVGLAYAAGNQVLIATGNYGYAGAVVGLAYAPRNQVLVGAGNYGYIPS